MFKCSICDKEFTTRHSLVNHERSHNSPIYKCPYCSYEIKRKFNFLRHIERNHRNELSQNLVEIPVKRPRKSELNMEAEPVFDATKVKVEPEDFNDYPVTHLTEEEIDAIAEEQEQMKVHQNDPIISEEPEVITIPDDEEPPEMTSEGTGKMDIEPEMAPDEPALHFKEEEEIHISPADFEDNIPYPEVTEFYT